MQGGDGVMEITLMRTDDVCVHFHGFGKSAFKSLPGELSKTETMKKMILGDAEIRFYLWPRVPGDLE